MLDLYLISMTEATESWFTSYTDLDAGPPPLTRSQQPAPSDKKRLISHNILTRTERRNLTEGSKFMNSRSRLRTSVINITVGKTDCFNEPTFKLV